MATVVIMPKQGQSVESCILTGIIKRKGDTVAVGDILFTYETDKASFEEEAKVAGTVLELFYDEGDEIPVLMNVMVIGNPGESTEEFRQTIENQEISVSATPFKQDTDKRFNEGEKLQGTKQNPEKNSLTPSTTAVNAITNILSPVSPRARLLAEKHAIQASKLSGSGPRGRVIERDVKVVIEASGKTTPLAKVKLNKDAMQIPETGSGLAGMVRGSDLSAFTIGADDSDSQLIPLTNIRKRIAKAMYVSLQNSAQLTHHLGADARRILSLRQQVKEAVKNGFPTDITLNDMICRATILALQKFQQANAHFLGDSIRLFTGVHLGFAVDTGRGLMVPTVRNAGDLSLSELSNQLKEIANTCKKGSINPDLLLSEAASFTISNLGNYGVEMFTPIINLPQVAILGVNTIVPRPKEMADGSYEFVPYLGLSLTYDHRALDGAEATRFLKQIAIEIENLDFEVQGTKF